jgi:hypothetical protein
MSNARTRKQLRLGIPRPFVEGHEAPSGHSREDIDASTAGRRLCIRHAIAKLKSKATLDIPENAAGGSKMKDLWTLSGIR